MIEKMGNETQEIIKQVLAELTEDTSKLDSWTGDTGILTDIGIDSLQLVKLLLKLEDRLEITIDYEGLSFEDVATIKSLEEYLLKQGR